MRRSALQGGSKVPAREVQWWTARDRVDKKVPVLPLVARPSKSKISPKAVEDLTALVHAVPRYLTVGLSASILGVCPRHLPTRFTLTRAVQHAQKHFAPPLRA